MGHDSDSLSRIQPFQRLGGLQLHMRLSLRMLFCLGLTFWGKGNKENPAEGVQRERLGNNDNRPLQNA